MTKKKFAGLQPNPKTPTSLKQIKANSLVKAALNYSRPIDKYVDFVLDRWQANLQRREPAPVYSDGSDGYPIYKGRDCDLFTFLMGVANRKAVIKIPDYKRRTPTRLRSDEWRMTDSPHGQVLSLISNKEAHSFSLRIKDFGVMCKRADGSEELGRFRGVMIVDYDGKLYKGLSRIEFAATDKEREFLRKHGVSFQESEKLLSEPFLFQHFVFPDLWRAFYKNDYLVAKSLAQRCETEGRLFRQRAKELEWMGVKLPPSDLPRPVEYEKPEQEKVHKKKVQNFDAKLVTPMKEPGGHKTLPIFAEDRKGQVRVYKKWPWANKDAMQDVLRYSLSRADDMSWGLGAKIRAIPRAVEYAMFLYGFAGERKLGNELAPDWAKWKRYKRDRLVLPVAEDVLLTYRIGEHTVEVKEQDFLPQTSGVVLENKKV